MGYGILEFKSLFTGPGQTTALPGVKAADFQEFQRYPKVYHLIIKNGGSITGAVQLLLSIPHIILKKIS